MGEFVTKPENPDPAEASTDRVPEVAPRSAGTNGAPDGAPTVAVPVADPAQPTAAQPTAGDGPQDAAPPAPDASEPPQPAGQQKAAPGEPGVDGPPTVFSPKLPPEDPASAAQPAAVGSAVPRTEQAPQINRSTGNPQPAGSTYGHSPNSVPAPPASARYGRPVAQPFNTQSSRGPSPNFSQPTVRIGGRVQPEQAAPQPSSARARPTRIPRRASLQLRYLEPWSVLKVSLVLSVAGFLAWMVAVGVLYSILGGMGVWDQLNGTYSDLTSVSNSQGSGDLISAGGVFGVAALVGLVNIVLITAMCTVGAFIYNASADLAGGIEVTLSERD